MSNLPEAPNTREVVAGERSRPTVRLNAGSGAPKTGNRAANCSELPLNQKPPTPGRWWPVNGADLRYGFFPPHRKDQGAQCL